MRILVIQTAFLGDAILASSVLETLHHFLPEARIDFLCTKAASTLFLEHPFLHKVIAWDKSQNKYRNLASIIRQVWSAGYTHVCNIQRFAATGFITASSGASCTSGFDKNPFSFLFSHASKHRIQAGIHEIDRNFNLIAQWLPTHATVQPPRIYPSPIDIAKVLLYQYEPYFVVAPASIWATKMWPEQHWKVFIETLSQSTKVYLIGAASDDTLCQRLIPLKSKHPVTSLAGQLSLMESAVLMQKAIMNYVQDSGPMHLASATNATVTVIYCSTVPAFGFGPLSTNQLVIEEGSHLPCRPCGLHGFKVCPEGHFKCGWQILPTSMPVPK